MIPLAIRFRRALPAMVAFSPTAIFVFGVYLGCLAWTGVMSLTSSKLLPNLDFVGLSQYVRLLGTERWILSVQHMAVYGIGYVVGCLVLGFVLAVAIDQRVRFENTFRTIFLFPYALSFIVTGAVWQWLFNPTMGLDRFAANLGWRGIDLSLTAHHETAIYALVIASIWQGAGLVMVILLAGLRGVDPEIWKATRVDGIPPYQTYVRIIIPELGPGILTSVVILGVATVKVYDLVVAMTQGGPGLASEVPAKFVMSLLFERANVGLAAAAATLMLLAVLCLLAPLLYLSYFRRAAR
jgi:glucose/mannose transport system permease protein